MIFEILGNTFSTGLDADKLPGFLFSVLKAHMSENEYFDDNAFIDFLEEHDEVERSMSAASLIVSGVQLEEWLEEISLAEDDVEDDDKDDAREEEDELYDDELEEDDEDE